jgi:hypothetical protein
MIRVALTDAAYDAIASTPPKGAARWPMQRQQGQWLHPSRGGGGRPHQGHAQTPATAAASHLAARRIGISNLGCASRPTAHFCAPQRGTSASWPAAVGLSLIHQNALGLGCAISRGSGTAHPDSPSALGQLVLHVDKEPAKAREEPTPGPVLLLSRRISEGD